MKEIIIKYGIPEDFYGESVNDVIYQLKYNDFKCALDWIKEKVQDFKRDHLDEDVLPETMDIKLVLSLIEYIEDAIRDANEL